METLTSVLLAEDDRELCSLMADFFAPYGFRLEPVHNGRDAANRALEDRFDLVILDVMMPGLDGFEVLRKVRQHSAIPVIMLTARTSQMDRIDGLNSGADDYLPKPFAPAELLARIRAVLRRVGLRKPPEDILVCGGLKLKRSTREVWLRNAPVAVTTIEFDILEWLARSPGKAVSRDSLTAALFRREATPFERSLDVHISHLRKKLEDDEEGFIHTVRGTGYMLAPRRRNHLGERSR